MSANDKYIVVRGSNEIEHIICFKEPMKKATIANAMRKEGFQVVSGGIMKQENGKYVCASSLGYEDELFCRGQEDSWLANR